MKKKFIGYYNPTNVEIDEAWSNGIFAFDANSLLNLYRYTDNTRNDFLRALQTIKDKLFLPFQAANEFHNNRLEVIEGVENSYENLYDIFPDNFEKYLKNQINQYRKHPSILIDKIIKLHSDFLNNLSKELNKQKKKHPDFKTKDEVLDEITDLFDCSVGEEFSKEDLLKIYKEGEARYSNETPPGYKDSANKQKKGPQHIYGDLIIWKELLNYTKNNKKPLVFITDDRKEDWWTIQKGKTIRPREELIKEFYDITGIRILIYNADNFLSFAKEKGLLPKLKNETIEEVKDIRVNDEKYYTIMSDFLEKHNQVTKNIIENINNQTYKHPNYVDFLNPQSYDLKNISDILNAQRHKSKSISNIFNAQSYIPANNISDILNTQTYTPTNEADILNDQNLALKNVSAMLRNQTERPSNKTKNENTVESKSTEDDKDI